MYDYMLEIVVFVAYGRKNPDSRDVLFFLQWLDFGDKEFSEKEQNFHVKEDCYNENVLMKKVLGKEDAVG